MGSGVARIVDQRKGLGYFAEVALDVERAALQPGVEFRLDGSGWLGQGIVEEVPGHGYDDWRDGARAGIAFALREAGATDARVCVHAIRGMTTDTNPWIVAAAAANAVWTALDFEPTPEVVARVDARVFASWSAPRDAVPSFDDGPG